MTTLDRRTFLLSTLGAAGAVALGGCVRDSDSERRADRSTTSVDVGSLEPAPRPTVRLPGAAFGFPSPFAYAAGIGYYQMSLLYDTLLWKDSAGRLLPWLARRFERSQDGSTWTFELREGVRWHDGQPLTAEDVVFTFEYSADQLVSPVVVARPEGVAEVRATGGRTVEIRLEEPAVTFPERVAGALPIVPKHIWSSVDDAAAAQDTDLLVGTGPYRVDSYEGDGGPLSYTAFDDYFLGPPFVERVEMAEVGDAFTALLADEIDAGGSLEVEGVRPATLAPFEADESFGIIEEKGNFTFPLYFNLDKGGPLADVRFRRACALAIDREDLVDRLAGGNAQPGNPGFLPPSNPFHAEARQYGFDRDAAERLLDRAGYERPGPDATREDSDGRPLRFELLFPNSLVPLAELVIGALEAVGIELTAKAVELGPQLFASKVTGAYEMAITLYPGPSAPGLNGDPDYLRSIYSSEAESGLDHVGGYVDRELDDLAARQRATFDRAERKRLVADMQRIVARDLPVLPLYYSTVYLVFRRAVLDSWYFTPGGFPVGVVNKQVFITGVPSGTEIRPTE
jgi:peptide/nickel transport system substrate-binding protein